MRLTFATAQTALASHAPDDTDILKDRINRAVERVILDGKWNGSTQRIAIACQNGDITLPRHYRTIEGVKISGWVTPLTNGWYEFLEGKGDCLGYDMTNVRSLGDGFAIMHDLPAGGDLETTEDLEIYGFDENYLPLTLTLAASTPTANPFTGISRVHKDSTTDEAVLTHTATDLTETVLARMEASEQETFYRRYRIDNFVDNANITEDPTVEALVKLRHIELVNDEDVLPITNITALGWAMDSLQYMGENDHTVADGYHNRAVQLLNQELQDGHSVDEVPTIKIHYPGGTTPRLQSFY